MSLHIPSYWNKEDILFWILNKNLHKECVLCYTLLDVSFSLWEGNAGVFFLELCTIFLHRFLTYHVLFPLFFYKHFFHFRMPLVQTPRWMLQYSVSTMHCTLCKLWSFFIYNIYTPMALPAMKHKKTEANIFQWKTLVTWQKNWHWFFFYFLGVFHRFSINTRIEVHFCSFVLGNERTLVACKSFRSANERTLVAYKSLRIVGLHKIYMWPVSFHFPMQTKALLKNLHATSVLSFPNANEKSTSILKYSKISILFYFLLYKADCLSKKLSSSSHIKRHCICIESTCNGMCSCSVIASCQFHP